MDRFFGLKHGTAQRQGDLDSDRIFALTSDLRRHGISSLKILRNGNSTWATAPTFGSLSARCLDNRKAAWPIYPDLPTSFYSSTPQERHLVVASRTPEVIDNLLNDIANRWAGPDRIVAVDPAGHVCAIANADAVFVASLDAVAIINDWLHFPNTSTAIGAPVRGGERLLSRGILANES